MIGRFGLCVALLLVGLPQSQGMTFRNECFGNAVEACYIVAEGELDAKAKESFEALLAKGVDGSQVLLNSGGGDLGAGLRLGREIRKRGMQTVIGRWNDVSRFEEPLNDGKCLSACAYAFLGGVIRKVPSGNKIGFHQFALASGATASLSAGQEASALLVSYLVEMGVDARLFALATSAPSQDMFYPSAAQLEEYDVVTPQGFAHFVLEPYRDGVIAASRRLSATRAYDEVNVLTAFCRNGHPRFLLTAPRHGLQDAMSGLEAGIELDRSESIRLGSESIRIRAKDAAHIEIAFPLNQVPRVLKVSQLAVYLLAPRAAGGIYGARITLNEMDRKMLATVFRFCI